MKEFGNPYIWNNYFPPVFTHTSISFLKKCPGFEEAKGGDIHAARRVISRCVKTHRIDELRSLYPDAELLPVNTGNRLPDALASAIGLEINHNVRNTDRLCRKSLSAMERLLNKPSFDGHVLRGKRYIIVDDIVTQGGTVSALRRHVIENGGHVAAVAALACSVNSRSIAPDSRDLYDVNEKFGINPVVETLHDYIVVNDLRELTRSELKYLLRFKNIHRLRSRLTHMNGDSGEHGVE